MEKQNTDAAEVEVTPLPKLQFKRLKRALEQIVDVALPFHTQLLNEQREAINNLKRENNLPALRQEQVKASKTVQLLKADLFELEQLNLQVQDEDQDQFHKKVQIPLKNAIETLSYFMISHSDVLGPFLNIEPNSITNPEEFPPVICDPTQESTENDEVSSGVVQLSTQVVSDTGAKSQAWSYLRKELLEIHSLITTFASMIFTQQESVDTVQSNIVHTQENVKEGTEYLKKASLLKAASFPLVGAIVGGVLLGPIGAVAGLKLMGSVACMAGGSALGYTAGKKLKQKHQAVCDIELKALTYPSKTSSNPELSRDLDPKEES